MWPAGDQRVHRGVRRLYETPRPLVVGFFVVVLDCHQGGQNEAGSETEPTSSCQEYNTTLETQQGGLGSSLDIIGGHFFEGGAQ